MNVFFGIEICLYYHVSVNYLWLRISPESSMFSEQISHAGWLQSLKAWLAWRIWFQDGCSIFVGCQLKTLVLIPCDLMVAWVLSLSVSWLPPWVIKRTRWKRYNAFYNLVWNVIFGGLIKNSLVWPSPCGSLIEHCPVHPKVTSSIPSQGTCPNGRFGPQLRFFTGSN